MSGCKRAVILILAGLLTMFWAPSVQAAQMPEITSPSALLMDGATGQVLYEKNSRQQRAPASVTKIMTLLLIFDAIDEGKLDWEETVTVSEHAASMGGSQVYLEPGEEQTVRELVKCIAIASANDASVAMAERIGGSEDGFVTMMNEKAKELGMEQTVFQNACGLPEEGHVTTAYDIALMSRALTQQYPEVTTFTTTWMDTITHQTRKGPQTFGLTNTNKLLKWYPDATGLKTGFTNEAMFCLSATASRDGMDFIAVILVAPDSNTRFREAMKLLDYGFGQYQLFSGLPKGEEAALVAVEKGEKTHVAVGPKEEFHFLAEKGGAELVAQTDLAASVKAPVQAGDTVGETVYFYDGAAVGRVPLVALEDVNRAGISQTAWQVLEKWLLGHDASTTDEGQQEDETQGTQEGE